MLREKKEIYCWKREINLVAGYVTAKLKKKRHMYGKVSCIITTA